MASVLRLVESEEVWHEKLLDRHIVMTPEAGGDATPIVRRHLSVLPTVYWLCRSVHSWLGWIHVFFHLSSVLVGGVAPLMLGIELLWTSTSVHPCPWLFRVCHQTLRLREQVYLG